MANRFPAFGNVLAHPPFDAVADPRKYFHVQDDFVSGLTTTGNVGSLGWSFAGTGAAVTYSGEAEHPGIATLAAATSGFASSLSLPQDVVYVNANGVYVAAQVRFPTAVTNTEFRFGLFDATPTGTTPTQGVFVELDSTNETEFTFNVDDNSVDTEKVGVDVVAADTWYTIEIVVTDGNAAAYVDGVLLTDPIDESLIANTTGLTAGFYLGDGTNADTVDIDWFAMRSRVARAGMTVE